MAEDETSVRGFFPFTTDSEVRPALGVRPTHPKPVQHRRPAGKVVAVVAVSELIAVGVPDAGHPGELGVVC